MRYVIDLDGTLTTKPKLEPKDYKPENLLYLEPNKEVINKVNKLHLENHLIIIYTSRKEYQRDITIDWLESHGVEFDYLLMNKPVAEVYVDDRSIKPEEL